MLSILKQEFIWRFILCLTLIAGAFRFFGLETAMPGFYIDESAVAAHILCLRETGTNVWGEILPLFSMMVAGGSTTPTYAYSGVFWTGLFGDSVTSYRSLTAFYSVVTLLGLYQLGEILFRDKRAGLLAALAGAISPWAFQFARIGWDSGAPPCFIVWSCVFALKADRRWHAVASGLLMVFAMYTYPPVRVHAVILAPFLLYLKYKREPGKRTLELAGISFLTAILIGFPLIRLTLEGGEFVGRSKMLSIFSDYYMVQFGGFSLTKVFEAFVGNMASFFHPRYLLLSGDSNLRHSTQSFGILSWLDFFAIVFSYIAIRARKLSPDEKRVLIFLVVGYLAGLIPAALTWESNPHALRSFSAQPFLALIVGWSLFRLWEKRRLYLIGASGIATVSFIALMYVHFAIYPERANIWFDTEIATYGKQKKSAQEWTAFMDPQKDYPRISRQYFLMAYGTHKCVPQVQIQR